jgi:hypothetical protein
MNIWHDMFIRNYVIDILTRQSSVRVVIEEKNQSAVIFFFLTIIVNIWPYVIQLTIYYLIIIIHVETLEIWIG